MRTMQNPLDSRCVRFCLTRVAPCVWSLLWTACPSEGALSVSHLLESANRFYQEGQYCRAAEYYQKHHEASQKVDSLMRAAEIHKSTCPNWAAAIRDFEKLATKDGPTARALAARTSIYEIMELDDPTSGLGEIPAILDLATQLGNDAVARQYLEIQIASFHRIGENSMAWDALATYAERFGSQGMAEHLLLLASVLAQEKGAPEKALAWFQASSLASENVNFERARLLEVLGREKDALSILTAMPASERREQRIQNLLDRMGKRPAGRGKARRR